MKDKEIDFSEVVTKAMRFAFANLMAFMLI